MADTTGIEWANASWNPWYGCKKVSPGCKYCYMYRDMDRYGRDPYTVTRAAQNTFSAPLKWARSGKVEPGARVFTCSWSDWFIEQADQWRDEAWRIVRDTPYTYLILTKRPDEIHDCLPDDWGEGGYPNVWLGASVETKEYLWRLEALSEIPAVVRFVSYEPALGPVDFTAYAPVIHWVISGGESGTTPRPASLDWFRAVRDGCQDTGMKFFHKQHGGSKKINGAWGGRLLDGRTWDEFPAESTHDVAQGRAVAGAIDAPAS